jgi:sugar lactone lactonase YvrE
MKAFIIFLLLMESAQVTLRAQLPSITNQPICQAVWAGGNVTFAVGVSGTGPFTYQWQLNSSNVPNGIITTVAGGGSGGDGGAATSASLSQICGDVAVDTSGNLFIPDFFNNRVRKVSISGIITTVAGGGNGGDGGAATNASLDLPQSVALDASGNLFIADHDNNRVRKVSTNGIITTVAGNGTSGYLGDGGAATNANLSPTGVAVDAFGNLFIADQDNSRVRKVSTNGIITTIAGGGGGSDGGAAANASLNHPFDVKVDSYGNIFIADTVNQRIRKVSTNGIITTFAGGGSGGDGGTATNASLNYPSGVAVDNTGNIFIADTDNNCIRKVDTNGTITTVAGAKGYSGNYGDGGSATNALFYYTYGVAVDASGNLFISDEANKRIRKVTNTQDPSLALNDLTLANAGGYQVVVTGSSGSVTSSVVNLVVATSPLIYQTFANSDRSLFLNFVSQPNSTNVVLCATYLSPPVVWQSISTNIAGVNGDWQFTDTNAVNHQMRFYRSGTQ